VFLVLPLLIFVWKELHPTKSAPATTELRGTKLKTNGKDKYVTWMEDNLPEFNETGLEQEEQQQEVKPKSVVQEVIVPKEPIKLANNETEVKEEEEDVEEVMSETFLSTSKKNVAIEKHDKDYREHLIAQLDGDETVTVSKSRKVGKGNKIEEQLGDIKQHPVVKTQKKKKTTHDVLVSIEEEEDGIVDRSTA